MEIPLSKIVENFEEQGLSWIVLEMINNDSSLSFQQIRKKLNVSQEKCYKEISRLEGGCLIVKKRNFEDERVINYSLTEYGKAALAKRYEL